MSPMKHTYLYLMPVSAALGLTLVGACTMHEVRDNPELPLVVPDAFAAATPEDTAAKTPDRWWKSFAAPELDVLVGRTLAGNIDLRRGWHRIAQARALVTASESSLFPTVNVNAGVGGQRSVFNVGEPVGIISNTAASYTLGIGASYELDLWGKAAAQAEAAEMDLLASRQDLESLAMTLAAQTTSVWMGMVGDLALLDLLASQEENSQTFATLIEARYAQGLASALEVYQQRQQVSALQAQRPLIEGRIRVAQHQLAALSGRTPQPATEGQRTLPALPAPPNTGLPVALLQRRPDIVAARMRVTAADHRVGAAIANQYPSINLSASTGFQSPDIGVLFEQWVWNLAANIVQPLFDGGRRSAEVDRQQAMVRDLLDGYASTLLSAVVEVEDALVQQAHQREHLVRLDAQLDLAAKSLAEARLRYTNGLSTYLNVLTALRTQQQTEQSRLAAYRQLLAYRIQLHRALGGSWPQCLAPAGEMADPKKCPDTTATQGSQETTQ
ncbi:MAG: multidrug efflux system outer membrane protein [Myxococcota bacterium]|jgi:multidrug efflux system outer membrane protein